MMRTLGTLTTRTADMVRLNRVVRTGSVPAFRAPVTADGARILTGPEVAPDIWRTTTTPDHVIGDSTAKTIASWLMSSADVDTPLTALAHGKPFDPEVLYGRVSELRRAAQAVPADVDNEGDVARLSALMAWALTWVRHVVVTTWRFTAEEWQAAREGEELDRSNPDRTDVLIVSEYSDEEGGWEYPGDPGYPADTTGLVVDTNDGGVWVPAGLVDTTLALLSGKGVEFWAQSNGGDPFGPGTYWEDADPDQQGDEYASRYEHPEGHAVVMTATLVGYTPAESLAVRETWGKRA